MEQNEVKNKIESDDSFLKEIRKLAKEVQDQKKIHELINLEDLIHDININRVVRKESKFDTISKILVKNLSLSEDDFILLFEILQSNYETSFSEYKEYVKSQINNLCVEAIKRDFEICRSMVFAKHSTIKHLNAIIELQRI